jgi:hypothetical protein
MKRYFVKYGAKTYRILAENWMAAAEKAENDYGPGFDEMTDGNTVQTPKDLFGGAEIAPQEGKVENTLGWQGGSDVDVYDFDLDYSKAPFAENVDEFYSENDRRESIAEALASYNTELLIDDPHIINEMRHHKDVSPAVKIVAVRSHHGKPVRPVTLGAALTALYGALDSKKSPRAQHLQTLINRIEHGIIDENFRFSGDFLMNEAIEKGGKEGYKLNEWNDYFKKDPAPVGLGEEDMNVDPFQAEQPDPNDPLGAMKPLGDVNKGVVVPVNGEFKAFSDPNQATQMNPKAPLYPVDLTDLKN